jgi:cytochrome b
MTAPRHESWIKAWDPIVRYGHWALVALFAFAYVSGDDDGGGIEGLHAWSGYAIAGILVLRLLWGLVGTRHARFSDFAFSPAAVGRYLIDMIHGRARRYIGHSPAAAAMIFALLTCLSATVLTGLVAYGEGGKGPLAGANRGFIATAQAEEHDSHHGRAESREGAVGELHEALANVTLGLVFLHILGVGLSSVLHRENLVRSMITGRKRPENDV